jgi:hypothetical protein
VDEDESRQQKVEDCVVDPWMLAPETFDGCVETDASHDADYEDEDKAALLFGWADWDDEGGEGVFDVEDGNYNKYDEGDEEVEERGLGVYFRGEMCGRHCLMIESEKVALHCLNRYT